MHYIAAVLIPEDKTTSFGVVVPDLPGCFSAGDNFDEAVANAREAIEFHLEHLIETKQDIPEPSAPAQVRHQYADNQVLVAIDINPVSFSKKARRINITMPEGLLYLVDKEAERCNMNRSSFLARAAESMLGK